EANLVTASPPESEISSARASIIGIEAFPIPSPYTGPSIAGRYFCTALNGSTASSAADRIRRRRGSCKLWVTNRLLSISVIISETVVEGRCRNQKYSSHVPFLKKALI